MDDEARVVINGIKIVKTAPGTIDPFSGLEIDEFRFSSDTVFELYENLLIGDSDE